MSLLQKLKMKYSDIFFVFVTAICLLLPVGSSAEFQLKGYLERKCVPKDAHQIDRELHKLFSHLDTAFTYIPDNAERFCAVKRISLEHYAKNSGQMFKRCVSGEEAYLPDFLEAGFYGFLDFLCANYAESIQKLFSEEGAYCLAQLKSSPASVDVDKCFEGLSPSSYHLTKTKLCQDITKTKHCFDGVLRRHCPGNRVIPELNAHLFHNLTGPCRVRGPAEVASSGKSAITRSIEVFWIMSIVPCLYKICW